jgi:hypothetical protein
MKAFYDHPFDGESITHWGVVFYPGKASDIPAEIQDKVKRHPHFSVAIDASTAVPLAEVSSERDELAAEYEAKFGKKPHHKMKTETIREAIDNADQS